MDPIQTSLSSEDKNLRHALKLKSFARDFKEALEIKLPGWNSDISKWQRLFPFSIPTSIDGNEFIRKTFIFFHYIFYL